MGIEHFRYRQGARHKVTAIYRGFIASLRRHLLQSDVRLHLHGGRCGRPSHPGMRYPDGKMSSHTEYKSDLNLMLVLRLKQMPWSYAMVKVKPSCD